MDREELMTFITSIDMEIVGELNERFNDCVVNDTMDYDNKVITIEVAEPFEDTEEVEEIIELALPYDYETNYTIEDYTITITIGRELNEWEQDMKESNCESYEEQYYSTETSHIASLYGAIQSLEELYTTQPFARDSQKYECLVSHFIEQKMECLKELKEVFEKYRTIIEEEEKAQDDLKEMKNMLNLF